MEEQKVWNHHLPPPSCDKNVFQVIVYTYIFIIQIPVDLRISTKVIINTQH